MEQEELNLSNYIKSYSNPRTMVSKSNIIRNRSNLNENKMDDQSIVTSICRSLTTKKAVEYLLNGTLKKKVCRFCLNEATLLSELDQILQVGGSGFLYKVTIRDMMASFHPYKVVADANFPNKICNKCIDRTISAYLFSQQCEQAERALRNCFDDMYDKLEKLDPINRPKKRGRQKANPNYNILYSEHKNVIDYAEPIINLIHTTSVPMSAETEIHELECLKCAQLLPNVESLLNHEKSHPSTMWFNCRLCGTAFVKRNHLKKHIKQAHAFGNMVQNVNSRIKCNECGVVSENYGLHLQHVEKHKFKMVIESLLNKDMNKLCSICLDKGMKMHDLKEMICLHGGYPEINGDRTLYHILGATLPNMNNLHNYTGTKVCDNCFNHAINSFIFINNSYCIKHRFNDCIDKTLDSLLNVKTDSNICIEISQDVILRFKEDYDELLLIDDTDYIDESKLNVDVLEDEFRLKSESSESEDEYKYTYKYSSDDNSVDIENPAKNVTKTYTNKKLVNGYQYNDTIDVCSEFLTFNKKKINKKCKVNFTCPMCSKHFITEYFLKRHIMKHVNKKVKCELCRKEFKSKFYLREHKKIHFVNKDSVSCKTCGRTFDTQNKLRLHLRTHTTKQCHLCEKVFQSQKYYDSHLQRHAVKFNSFKNKSLQTCSFCEKECTNDNQLSLHVNKTHLQIKPYNCEMCDRYFYTERNLKCHKRIHSLPSKEVCDFCDKKFKCRKDIVVHVRKHLNVKPFRCSLCELTFYSETGRRTHMVRIHGGKFCCRLCKTVFSCKSDLKLHVNTAHSFI